MSTKKIKYNLFFIFLSCFPFLIQTKQEGSEKTVEPKKLTKWGKFCQRDPIGKMRKNFSKLKDDELETLMKIYEKEKNTKMMVKALEKKIGSCSDPQELRLLKLRLANIHYDSNNLEKAGKLYSEYMMLYPGSQEAEYVEYKALLCHFYNVGDYERDQGTTRNAIRLAENFLKKKTYKKYNWQVQSILNDCYSKLLDHEVGIFDFYLKHTVGDNNINSAQRRLDHIKTFFRDKVPNYDEQIKKLENSLKQKQNPIHTKKKLYAKKRRLGKEKYKEIVQKAPPKQKTVEKINDNKIKKPKRDYVKYF